MKRIRYTKFTGDLASVLGLEDLMQSLSEFLLDSGFKDPYADLSQRKQTLDELRDAIEEALESGDLFDEESQQKFDELSEEEAEEIVEQLLQKLQEQNFINAEQSSEPGTSETGEAGSASFEVTDKSMDFLGYKALRDTLNLDITATLSSVFAREGLASAIKGEERAPLQIEYSDLYVHQSDYHSSCATVVLLDCSHSMILYGEDRFTPAKRVAMALSHLIRTQFPGDTLNLVLFHDTAEEIPLSQLPRVRVGPHYTNTREGLRLAQRILARQSKEMKQIVMITDGKPSALTLPNGRIYKNAYGLDPLVLTETLEEVSRCKRSGITINTFMLASEPSLMQFVQQVSAMCRGKAYFTSPQTLGSYLLMDFLSRRMKTVH